MIRLYNEKEQKECGLFSSIKEMLKYLGVKGNKIQVKKHLFAGKVRYIYGNYVFMEW